MTALFLNLDSSRDSFDVFQPTHPSTLKTPSRTLKDDKSSAVMVENQDKRSNPIRTQLLDNLEVLHLSSARARYSRMKGGSAPASNTTTEKWTNWNPTNPFSKEKKLYKTELCRSWEESGKCRYDGKCQYAHGVKELRALTRHPKFKTEVCCAFVTLGACPYGRRCRFLHRNVPITALGKQISMKEDSSISNTNCIKATSRRLPIFINLAQGVESSSTLSRFPNK